MTSKSETINRQSFSDRICDDFCEILLSYLSLEDKFRYECVSKQFQRVIFNKINVLKVNYYSREKTEVGFKYFVKAFESVIKKCQFINQINIVYSTCFTQSNNESLLKLIIKYCNHLKEIEFYCDNISDRTLRQFGQKFGQKLKTIHFQQRLNKKENINPEEYKTLLRFCPNLIQMTKELNHNLSLFIDKNELLVPKLTKVCIDYSNEDIENMKIFANNLKNTLKSIEFSLKDFTENAFIDLIGEIIHLKSLNELIIEWSFDEETTLQLTTHLIAIGIQCKQLKRFEFTLNGKDQNLIYEVFNTMSYFKKLKYLKIEFFEANDDDYDYEYDDEQNLNQNKEILSNSLKECQNLTHLCLDYNKINDNFFVNIHLNLPNIKYLEINMSEFTDKAMHSLSKLTKLETLICEHNEDNNEDFPYVTDSGVCDLIYNCHQIKRLSFNSRPNITHKTIEELIKLALNKPKVQFKHNFNYISSAAPMSYSGEDLAFSIIDLNDFKNLPKNLIINDFTNPYFCDSGLRYIPPLLFG